MTVDCCPRGGVRPPRGPEEGSPSEEKGPGRLLGGDGPGLSDKSRRELRVKAGPGNPEASCPLLCPRSADAAAGCGVGRRCALALGLRRGQTGAPPGQTRPSSPTHL